MIMRVLVPVLVPRFMLVVVTVLGSLTFFRCLTTWRGRFCVVRLIF
jgi:hypothetical protein